MASVEDSVVHSRWAWPASLPRLAEFELAWAGLRGLGLDGLGTCGSRIPPGERQPRTLRLVNDHWITVIRIREKGRTIFVDAIIQFAIVVHLVQNGAGNNFDAVIGSTQNFKLPARQTGYESSWKDQLQNPDPAKGVERTIVTGVRSVDQLRRDLRQHNETLRNKYSTPGRLNTARQEEEEQRHSRLLPAPAVEHTERMEMLTLALRVVTDPSRYRYSAINRRMAYEKRQ
ncbi:hypothetical protein DFH07DRAFT_944719 [Mycena maculata]|uniref:Uncharacterized protein n=1 Tax=Mycena maculata TaxID=230809 RepID=A0AAD7MVC7_9AGAR|nr:hypothetical protein DFH07DRAFT_944719 [Mycena maculata]